jgi:hypothetical protein
LDSWRPNRDVEGWKLSFTEIAKARQRRVKELERTEPPERMEVALRLKDDLEALRVLLELKEPPKRRIRSTKCLEVFYGFGDASAMGHSTNFQRVINKGTHLVIVPWLMTGRWRKTLAIESNFWI